MTYIQSIINENANSIIRYNEGFSSPKLGTATDEKPRTPPGFDVDVGEAPDFEAVPPAPPDDGFAERT